MSGHTCNGVVQNNRGRIGRIVRNIHQTRHAGMHKGRVSNNANCFLFTFLSASLVKAMQAGNRCTHTKGRIQCIQRCSGTQRIASDITQNGYLIFSKCIEHATMRAACTHNRRTNRDVFLRLYCRLGILFQQNRSDQLLRKFSGNREQGLSLYGNTNGFAVCLDDRIQFLDYNNPFHTCSKLLNQLDRKRMNQTQFQNADPIAEYFLHILIRGTGSNDTQFAVTQQFHPVKRTSFCKFGQSLRPLFHFRVPANGIGWCHNIFLRILLVGLPLRNNPFSQCYDGLRVCNTGTSS